MDTNKRQLRIVDEAFSFVGLALLVSLLFTTGFTSEEEQEWIPGEPNLFVEVDRSELMVGDPVELSIRTITPANTVIELPEPGREKEIVVLNRSRESTPLADGHVQTDTHYTLTSFRLGKHLLTTQPVIYRQADTAETNDFPEIIIQVISSLGENASSEIADIKPVHKLPGRVPPWLWIAPGTALIAFLVGMITSRLWKKREEILPTAPPVPPHVIAFNALDALKSKGLLERNECKPFYTGLSLILRTYLEGRFRLNAPEETTEEIVEEMSRSSELNGLQRNILQDFMRQADIVKFARGHPDRGTMEAAFDTTKQFVEETKLITEQDD
jgi:hypothetical protein